MRMGWRKLGLGVSLQSSGTGLIDLGKSFVCCVKHNLT